MEATTEIPTEQAVQIIDVMQVVRDALHGHALGFPLTPERANELRYEIDHALNA